MQVLAFFEKVEIHLIAHEQLMAAVADAYRRCVGLITVAYVYTVETSPHHHRYGIVGTVCHAAVHHLLVVSIYQPPCKVSPIDCAVSSAEHRHWYC